MFRNRRRNWLIKRVALGFAVAAVAAPVAQARVDEGLPGQPNSSAEILKVSGYRAFMTDFPSSPQVAFSPGPHGLPSALPSVHQPSSISEPRIEFVRMQPSSISEPRIEFIRTHPRSTSPEIAASRFGRPNATTGTELEAVNWQDVGIGAGLALALVVLGGGAALASRHMGREQTA